MAKNKTVVIDEKTPLLIIAGPMFMELFLNILLNNIDTLMLSHYSDYAAGTVGNANQVMFLVIIMFNIIATATSVVVAQYLGAIGMISKAGRYGGTYAHSDITFEFASWISPEFKLYIIEDYQRLKAGENARLSLGWNLNRELSKLNYRIHTDAIKVNLIPPMLTPQQISYTYASEADLLNTVLFGKTAKEWRDSNPEEKGNIRDHATIHQLLVLANMESYNAILIKQGKTQAERMPLLHELAVQQMTTLSSLELSNLPGIEKK